MDVSVEARNHYVSMLSDCMTPIMAKTFIQMYKESIERAKGHRDNVQKTFKVLLDEVQNWNNSIIQVHTAEYVKECEFFTDLLAAVFVCYIRILSCVQTKKNKGEPPKKIDVRLPTNDSFIHACINTASKEFVKPKHMNIFREVDEMVREQKIEEICRNSVITTINFLMRTPVKTILRTYLNPDSTDLSIGGEGGDEEEDDDAKDIQIPEESLEPDQMQPSSEFPVQQPQPDQPDQLVRDIPVGQQPHLQPQPQPQPIPSAGPSLFEDAPMTRHMR
jgi:hypothetical protein